MKKKLRTVLMVVLIAVFLVSGGMTVKKASEYRQGEAIYEDVEELAGVDSVEALAGGDDGLHGISVLPPEIEKALSDINLEKLREKNKDVFGWILIPGADISYPLLDGKDNSYYLTHTWDKQWNHMGSIFLEQECKADLSDFNTIIYGHNMRNTTMFSNLKKYAKEGFWEKAPHVYIVTEEGVFRYDIFAAYEVSVGGHAFWLYVEDAEQKQEFISRSAEMSEISTGIVPSDNDRIITLSTCTGNGHEKRMVVQAVLAKEE